MEEFKTKSVYENVYKRMIFFVLVHTAMLRGKEVPCLQFTIKHFRKNINIHTFTYICMYIYICVCAFIHYFELWMP